MSDIELIAAIQPAGSFKIADMADITPGTASRFYYSDGTDVVEKTAAEVMALLGFTATAAELEEAAIEIIIDGSGSPITTGIKGDLEIPFDCSIQQVTMLPDQSGTIVVDIWVDSYANFPPTDADSITAAAPPTITATTKSQDSTLTNWTTALTKGQIMRFNVDSDPATSITRVTISLQVLKT